MAWIGFSYMAGLLLAFVLKCGVRTAVILTAVSAAALIAVLCKKRSAVIAVCCFSAAAGILGYALRDTLVYEKAIAYDGKQTEFSGIVMSSEYYGNERTKYILKGKLEGNIPAGVILITDKVSANAGDRLTFTGKASKFRNTYSYSSETSNKAKGIYLEFYSAEDHMTERSGYSFLLRTAENIRDNILDMINSYMPKDEGALMTAMLLGDSSSMESRAKTAMLRSGCGHIMAVSGIHMTVVYSFVFGILINIAGKKASFIISAALLFIFCMITGFSQSAVRAYIMLFTVGAASIVNRRGDTLNSLGIAVMIITVISPFAIADRGFILSFAGVVGAGAAAPKAVSSVTEYIAGKKQDNTVKLRSVEKSFISSLCAFAVTFPVSVLFFDEVSLLSPLTNVFIVPFCTAALTLGAAAVLTGGSAFIAKPLLYAASLLCRGILNVSELLSSAAVFIMPTGSGAVRLAAAAITSASAAAFILYRDTAKVCVTVITAIAAVVLIRYMCMSDTVKAAVFLDGGGQAVVVHNRSNAVVIDIDGGAHTADKYLRQCGIYDIDLIYSRKNEDQNYLSYSGTYDIGRYIQVSDSTGLADCGYAELIWENEYNAEIKVSDKVFKITDRSLEDEEVFCTVFPKKGTYSAEKSRYVICTDGGGCSSEGEVYKDCCIEFSAESGDSEGRYLYNGGNN